jgi:hypothetical protein
MQSTSLLRDHEGLSFCADGRRQNILSLVVWCEVTSRDLENDIISYCERKGVLFDLRGRVWILRSEERDPNCGKLDFEPGGLNFVSVREARFFQGVR